MTEGYNETSIRSFGGKKLPETHAMVETFFRLLLSVIRQYADMLMIFLGKAASMSSVDGKTWKGETFPEFHPLSVYLYCRASMLL